MNIQKLHFIESATEAVDIIRPKWNVSILLIIAEHQTIRYGKIKELLSDEIRTTVLTRALKELTENELITREQFNYIPPYVEYTITKSGLEYVSIINKLASWGSKYL